MRQRAIPFNIHTPRWKRYSEGPLISISEGGRCVGAFDLLNISEGVWKKMGFFLRGKENLGNFWRGARVGTFDLWFLRGKFWLTSSIGGGVDIKWNGPTAPINQGLSRQAGKIWLFGPFSNVELFMWKGKKLLVLLIYIIGSGRLNEAITCIFYT